IAGSDGGSVMQKEIIEIYRLSPQQERLWSLLQADNNRAYGALCSILIEGKFETEVLKQALQATIDRYEILRATFHSLPGMTFPVQAVTNNSLLAIEEHDLTAEAPDLQERAVNELFDGMKAWPFDFEQGPLVRFSLSGLSPEKQVLFVGLSALCADATTLSN